MKLNPKVTLDRVMEAVERYNHSLDNPGFCAECGAEVDGVEPDARKVKCECCGERAVYGAEELLIGMI